MLPGLGAWPREEKRALVEAIRAKGSPCEADYARRVMDAPRFRSALIRVGKG